MDFPQHGPEDAERYAKFRWWPGITLGDLLDKAADVYPLKEALVDDRVRLTYAQLRERVDRLAVGLIAAGIENGDTVLLQLPNWAEFVYFFFALQKVGAIPVLLISQLRQLEVSHLCQLTEAKGWIVPVAHRDVDYASFIGRIKEDNPQLRHIISVRAASPGGDFTATLEGLMERELTAEDRRRLASRRPEPTRVAHILPSGGTTGLPKGIPRTHNDYLCNVEYVARAGEMNTGDTWVVAVPVAHNLGLLVGVTGCIFSCAKLVLVDSTRPWDIWQAIQKERATFMPTVPSLLKRVIDFEGIADYDLSSLKKVAAGGEASSPELIRRVHHRLGCTYINEFGMSEGPLCRTRPDYDLDIICRTVGQPCCPYDQFRVVDGAGNELSVNTEGELAATGPSIFAGYLKNPEENARAFTADGFFRTGDRAMIDSWGNISITGRIKDIIIRGGENISPAQVEQLLLAYPGIADAAVIGMPDEALGERVCAYIQSAPGVSLSTEDIEAFMRNQGASRLLIPERFEFVDSLPMTQAAKHDKKALREDIQRRLKRR